jgi:DNA-binding CsgD family transcriptional regulator
MRPETSTASPHQRPGTSSLIEREGALQALRSLLDAAGGAGHVVVLAGEAGVGKTSVLRAAAAAGPGVWWGECDALQTPQALRPLLDIASQHRTRFGAALNGPRAALFEAVLDDLRLAPKPLLVVIEDAHWADEATLDLIKFLARRIQRTRALLVVSYRDDEVSISHPLRRVIGDLPADSHTRIHLDRLTEAGVATLARRSLRSPAGLFEATAGNPFFLTELLRHPSQQLPSTVQDLVLARFARLDKPAQEIVCMVSVEPGRLEHKLLLSLLDPALAQLEACLDSGLLVADGPTIGFRHELARVAVESALSAPVAQALHRRMLQALEAAGGASTARLAHHAALAGDEEAVRRYAPAAAAEARSQGARREAARHLRNALHLGGKAAQPGERIAWLEAFAVDSVDVDRHDEALTTRRELDALYRQSGDTAAQAANLSRLALVYVYMMRNAEADRTILQAIELLESLPPGALLATAYGVLASLCMLNRDCEQSVQWSEKSIALAREHGDTQRTILSLSTGGTARMFIDYDAGCRQMLEALASARQHDMPVAVANALLNLGSASGELMRLPQAVQWLQEGIGYAAEHELDGSAHYSLAWLALCELYQGRWDAAAERAGRIANATALSAIARVMALVALGRQRLRRGDPGSQEVLDEALRLAGPTGTLQRIAPVRAACAEAAYARGDMQAVSHETEDALALAQEKGHPWFIGELAFWRWRAGLLGFAPARSAEPYALQISGDWRGAASSWERVGCPYEQARALADGDPHAQQQALLIFDKLGARPAAEALRKQLQSAGVKGVLRGARASTQAHPHGLTTRELEVLSLLCQGMRNADIAAQLSRSVRTVDHHLASVFAKLGVDSRVAAIQAAQRAGLGGAQFGQPPAAK